MNKILCFTLVAGLFVLQVALATTSDNCKGSLLGAKPMNILEVQNEAGSLWISGRLQRLTEDQARQLIEAANEFNRSLTETIAMLKERLNRDVDGISMENLSLDPVGENILVIRQEFARSANKPIPEGPKIDSGGALNFDDF